MKARYYVQTWDTNKQDFTPQKGVRSGPYSLFGLRKAIRKLRKLGYSVRYRMGYGDPAVSIWRAMP